MERHLERVLLVLVFAAWAALKTYGLNPAAGDENIYFYMATRTAEGALPYRDFFFAHPPLHLLPGVIIALFGGFSLIAFKLQPVLLAGAAGYFVWRMTRRHLGSVEAMVALVLFLFAHDLLRGSSHWTGANTAVALLAAGLDAMLDRRDRTAGICFAGGALAALYVAPVAALVSIVRWVEDRSGGNTLIAMGLIVFAAVNLLFILLAGGDYLDQVYTYHLTKPPTEGAFGGAFGSIALKNSVLVWSPVVALAALILERGGWLPLPGALSAPPPDAPVKRKKKRHQRSPGVGAQVLAAAASAGAVRRHWADPRYRAVAVSLAAVIAATVFLSSLSRLYHFYFLIAFPPLAVLGGYGLGGLWRSFVVVVARSRGGRPDWKIPAVSLLVLAAAAGPADYLRHRALLTKSWYLREGGSTKTYDWRPSPVLPAFADRMVREVVWRDDRVIGKNYLGVTYYLWHESRVFDGAAELAAAVHRLTPEGGTLFGDSTSAPLIALLTGRRLALDEADTNFMRFRSGMTPPAQLLGRLAAEPPAAVIFRPRRGLATIPEIRDWVQRWYQPGASVEDRYQGTYTVHVRRPSP